MRSGPRLLYVDINASFLNPTRGLILPALMRAGETCCFGPGYVDSKTLGRGLGAFLEANGAFDLVIANTHSLFAGIYDGPLSPRLFERSYALDFPPEDVALLPAIGAELERIGASGLVRVAMLLESDYYNWQPHEIDALERRADYVIGFGPEFWRHKAALPDLDREVFAARATDAWADWVHANADRVASMFHFVADGEFRWSRLAHRKRIWALPGIPYHARATARAALARHGIRPLGESPLRRGMGLAKRLRLMRREPRWMQHYLNLDHQDRLSSCRYAFTCGSGLDMPIRKFVEIPAAGTVLVCKPFSGFTEAGFRDGENAVVCRPDEIMAAHRMLESDPARAQHIADAGRRLVFERHSLAARARQLADTLAAMADRSFAGGRWVGGCYTVVRRRDVAAP
jgi:hypothetical protein